MTDVPVKFTLSAVRPDQRQYRQQEIELYSDIEVQVLIPLTAEYIANFDPVIQAKLGSGGFENPILTVAGLKYVIDQFDAVFLKEEEKKVEKTDDDDWGDDLPPAKVSKPAPAKVEEENWDNDTKKPDEVPWDESTEEWQ